jgi:hypothetical protein
MRSNKFYEISRRGRVGFIAALAIGSMSGGAFAESFEAECERRLTDAQVIVTPQYALVKTDFTLAYSQLSQIMPTSATHRTVGLTHAVMSHKINYGYIGLSKAGSNSGCARPKLEISLSFSPMTVYVGREFPPGSCAFNHIYEHEARHVQAYNQHLAYVASKLQAELSAYFGSQIYYGNPKKLGADWRQQVEQIWVPRAKAWMELVHQSHAQIDTPAEYARNSVVCNGYISQVLSAGR